MPVAGRRSHGCGRDIGRRAYNGRLQPPSSKSLQRIARLFFWLGVCVVLATTLAPSRMIPSVVFQYWDKAQHALAFAGLAGAGLVAYGRHWRWIVGGLVALGAAIEVAQAWSGWRQGDWLDWLADGVGIAAALAVYLFRQARRGARPGEAAASAAAPAARARSPARR